MSFCFQDRGSLRMGELFVLHDHIMVIILRVFILISYIMVYLFFRKKFYKFLSEGTFIETIWSIIPAFLLIVLVLPSIKVLYIIEDVKSPVITFKVVAHQWYWSYLCPLFKNFSFSLNQSLFSFYEFDSIMDEFFPRLLSCSSDLFVPVNTSFRIMITSTDVIHSFALPALGLKVDAIPGRINQLFSNPIRLGQFFGQCSEICGSNHSFMPISLKVCEIVDFDRVRKSYFLEELEGSINF